MSNRISAKPLDELSQSELVQWVMEGFRRTLVHYGLWLSQVDYQLGTKNMVDVEAEAGDTSLAIMLKRLSKVLGFELEDGVPVALKNKSREELLTILDSVSVNWLANDGVWFQAVENSFGMNDAKRCNDTCWTRFSPYEAMRIKKLVGMPEHPGLEGLKTALQLRMYSRVNVQSIEEVDESTIIFRMNECRVQAARKRKGLPDYPCKTAGLVEYPYFATAIDSRIVTECIGCPPDEHPEDWWCAWKFTLHT